jgi:glycerol-3-phosphate dehydrogenase
VVDFRREAMLDRLRRERFDVLVVGGGITGVGAALDAASRGLRTALIERDDFAAGTSSKSSKLIHGGLRYLQQGEVRLVYEALAERRRLQHNAPHLVRPLPFMIPILTRDGVVSRKIAKALGSAMWMYDLTGGWRIGKIHRRLKPEAAFAHLPTMDRKRLASAYLYYDATADDARLCLTVARTAADHGAVVVNGTELVELTKNAAGLVNGAIVVADGQRFAIETRTVVNATGVWSDTVRRIDEGSDPRSIRPAKGIHITIPWAKVGNDVAVVIPVPKDKRSLFIVPFGDTGDGTFHHCYVGTTDTDYAGSLDDPQATPDDIGYVLRALNASLNSGITEADITASWAGLRPLVNRASTDRTADLSRRHMIVRSPGNVFTVAGGKLTTYRQMAADTIDQVVAALGERPKRCRTKRLLLRGAKGFAAPPDHRPARHLAERFGSDAGEIQALIDADGQLGEALVAGLPYVRAEAIYAVRHEMARSVDDVLSRRTRARLLDRAACVDAATDVAALIAGELGWSPDRTAAEAQAFVDSIEHERRSGSAADAST